jgi:hypothetical protein
MNKILDLNQYIENKEYKENITDILLYWQLKEQNNFDLHRISSYLSGMNKVFRPFYDMKFPSLGISGETG